MASVAGLGGFQVAVKGQALLAVQAGCSSGLGQPSGAHCPLKQPHQDFPFRN